VSAGAASVPRPEECPRGTGRTADPCSRDEQHEADDGFAGVLTAIADDRAGPPAPPGRPPDEAAETPARTATAEGQEGESDSPAQTGIEQALVALAAAPMASPLAALEAAAATPPHAPEPQQGAEPLPTPALPTVATEAEPAQAAPALRGPETPPTASLPQVAEQPEESPAAGLVAPRGEGEQRLDGKRSSTPHRPTPTQSATAPAADAALDAPTEARTAETHAPSSGTPTPVAPAVAPQQADDAKGAARQVRPAAQAQAEHRSEPAGAAATAPTGPIAKDAPGAAPPAHDTPRATATEPAQTEQPAAPPATAVGGTRQVELGAKAAATAPHGRTQLHELVARVREIIRVTVREERTEARITLHPAELGEVRIRISYGPGGISASIVADSSRAAQTLAQSTPELRRTLEEHGLTLQSVDVQVGGEGSQLGSENGPGGTAAGSDRDARREPTGDTSATPDDDNDPDPSLGAPLGAYVDVLA